MKRNYLPSIVAGIAGTLFGVLVGGPWVVNHLRESGVESTDVSLIEFPIVNESDIECTDVPLGTTASPRHYPEREIGRVQSFAGLDDRVVRKNITTVVGASIFCTKYLRGRERENSLTGCARAMVSTAYLLGDDSFPAYGLLLIGNARTLVHTVFLYRDREYGQFGTIGCNAFDINPPIHDTLTELVDFMGRRSGNAWNSFYVFDFSGHVDDLREGKMSEAILKTDSPAIRINFVSDPQ